MQLSESHWDLHVHKHKYTKILQKNQTNEKSKRKRNVENIFLKNTG